MPSMDNYGDPIAALIERLEYHVQPTRLLAGWKLKVLPVEDSHGDSDLPAIRIFNAGLDSQSLRGRIWTARMSVGLTVYAKRKDGLPALWNGIGLVNQAILTDITSGRIDPGFNGTLAKPFALRSDAVENTDLSFGASLILEMEIKPFDFGASR